jgi:hypothetical protein
VKTAVCFDICETYRKPKTNTRHPQLPSVSKQPLIQLVLFVFTMGKFDPNKYDFDSDYERSIREAKADLESDYPNARVFINYLDGGSPSVVAKEIRLAPPDGESSIIRGSFQVPRHTFNWTYGYAYLVFSEGIVDYEGRTG